jgi:conserved oligomeric Golgi complex subunit 6
LQLKTDLAVEAEHQLKEVKASLETALADVEAKSARIKELEDAKAELESQVKEAQDSLSRLQSEHEEGVSTLKAVQEDVRNKLHFDVHAGI